MYKYHTFNSNVAQSNGKRNIQGNLSKSAKFMTRTMLTRDYAHYNCKNIKKTFEMKRVVMTIHWNHVGDGWGMNLQILKQCTRSTRRKFEGLLFVFVGPKTRVHKTTLREFQVSFDLSSYINARNSRVAACVFCEHTVRRSSVRLLPSRDLHLGPARSRGW